MTVTVPQIPLPVPSAADPENFPERGDAVVGALPAVIDGMNAQNAENNQLHGEIHDKVDEAMNAGLADAADNAAAANQAKLDAEAAVPLASAQADRAQAQADRAEQAAGEAGALPPIAGQNNKYLAVAADGVTLVWKSVNTMTGATAGAAGAGGLVPQPVAGQQRKVLHGDGTWRNAAGEAIVTVATYLVPGTYSYNVTESGWYSAEVYGAGSGGSYSGAASGATGGTSSATGPGLAISATGGTNTQPGLGTGGDVNRSGGNGSTTAGTGGSGGGGPVSNGSPGTPGPAGAGGAGGGGLAGTGGTGGAVGQPGQNAVGVGGGGGCPGSIGSSGRNGTGGGYSGTRLRFFQAGDVINIVVGAGGAGAISTVNGGNGGNGAAEIKRLV